VALLALLCSQLRGLAQKHERVSRFTSADPRDTSGRGGGIRTHDPLHPMQVRYLAALRPDEDLDYSMGLEVFSNSP